MKRPPSNQEHASFIALAVLTIVVLGLVALMPVSWQAAFAYQRYDFSYWQLLTAGFVHENVSHLMLNLVAVAVIAVLINRSAPPTILAGYLLLGTIGATGAEHLLSKPPALDFVVVETRGLSGGLHGLLVGGSLALARRGDQWAVWLVIVVTLKVASEATLGRPIIASGTVENVAVMAHLGGTLVILLAVGLQRWVDPERGAGVL
ncbi:rhomboid family intramembrane serine protease [Luminiphilus sp.]|nr:rhomboid family intramembrane serine protease [Luminiphilus sp.]MDB2622898.1 rhomboid family intramembrane serine protease [Luminiphilus sp.]